ncbi:alpha/beta fold hydrolase [Streptomyces sp. NPDC014891]|uniref:alpha/beta fold hydrolase n=1 Tax=Streptomyces sp. NPDC014891 TaxID=3364929 RepID=UPI0036F7F1FA
MSDRRRGARHRALNLPEPRVDSAARAEGGAAGVVLLLHGGRADSFAPPPTLNLAGLRMRPFARALRGSTRTAGLLVGSVRFRMRGWNGERADPVDDARQALADVEEAVGPLPVVLLGHSMGARAALRAADAGHVRGVVALAPWCPPGEPVSHLAGRTVIALHDEADAMTSAAGTWAYLRRAEEAGARVRGVRMPTGRHTMLRGAGLWHRLAARFAAEILHLPVPPGAPTPRAGWGAGPTDAAAFRTGTG